jgi:hypothetical protein
MKNVLDKGCRENQNATSMFNNFFSENRAVYDICGKMWQSDKPQMTIRACALHAG